MESLVLLIGVKETEDETEQLVTDKQGEKGTSIEKDCRVIDSVNE